MVYSLNMLCCSHSPGSHKPQQIFFLKKWWLDMWCWNVAVGMGVKGHFGLLDKQWDGSCQSVRVVGKSRKPIFTSTTKYILSQQTKSLIVMQTKKSMTRNATAIATSASSSPRLIIHHLSVVKMRNVENSWGGWNEQFKWAVKMSGWNERLKWAVEMSGWEKWGGWIGSWKRGWIYI